MTLRKIFYTTVSCLSACILVVSAWAADEPQKLASLDARLDTGLDVMQVRVPAEQVVQQALSHLRQRIDKHPRDYEASLIKSIIQFKRGKTAQALSELNGLIKRAPDFHLAHLVRGDMLMSRFRPVAQIGGAVSLINTDKKIQSKLDDLREEARYRLASHTTPDWHNRTPLQILGLGDSVHTALLVDKSNHRLYIFERKDGDSPPQLVRDYYVSTGKKRGNKTIRGDLRTPEGVYFVTSWIPKEKLPDKYGTGAFPVNYPNELDQRLGKTGYGIWLHGTESKYYSRPPLDSEGCVVLTNMDLDAIKKHIEPGITPVVITDSISWVDEQHWRKMRTSLFASIEQWRQDWESMDVERYLGHYAENFWSKSHNYKSWAQRKRYLSKSKSYQKVALSDISVLLYPDNGTQDMAVVRLRQQYQSNNYNGTMQKRLYLSRVNDRWKIVYEGR